MYKILLHPRVGSSLKENIRIVLFPIIVMLVVFLCGLIIMLVSLKAWPMFVFSTGIATFVAFNIPRTLLGVVFYEEHFEIMTAAKSVKYSYHTTTNVYHRHYPFFHGYHTLTISTMHGSRTYHNRSSFFNIEREIRIERIAREILSNIAEYKEANRKDCAPSNQ